MVKAFYKSIYLLNFKIDHIDTLPVPRSWSEVSCYTRMTNHHNFEVKVMDFEIKLLCFRLNFHKFISPQLLYRLVDTLPVARYWSEV